MRADRPLLLLLAALTVGCADPEPFVDQGNPTFTIKTEKPRDTVLEQGTVQLCYSSATPWAEVEKLAQERCATRGLRPMFHSIVLRQCRATSPHRATFLCYDPEMMTAAGAPVNPFNPEQVAAWEKRTGKVAKPHNFMTAPGGPVANPAAEPPAQPAAGTAPITAPPPLTPEGIAERPASQQPLQPPITPAPSAPPTETYPPGNFSLPQGSWGDAFQE